MKNGSKSSLNVHTYTLGLDKEILYFLLQLSVCFCYFLVLQLFFENPDPKFTFSFWWAPTVPANYLNNVMSLQIIQTSQTF